MDLLLQPVIDAYRLALQPLAPFTWFGIPLSALDIAAAVRLCTVMRQIREVQFAEHGARRVNARRSFKGKLKAREAGVWDSDDVDTEVVAPVQERSFARDAAATLLVVYGGEIMTAPLLGASPSFMYSGFVPIFYTLMQAFVERLPVVPSFSLTTELPLALFDGLSRAYLLCNLIPPSVTTSATPALRDSPWTLLLTTLITANGGFLLVNAFSFLAPTALTFTTPTELLPYGWTTTDIWCAPLVTALFALLTHAQPFWADAHTTLAQLLAPGSVTAVHDDKGALLAHTVAPVDAEVARAACAAFLATMFAVRAGKNFGGLDKRWREWTRRVSGASGSDVKEKVQ